MKKIRWLLLWMTCVIIFFTGCSFLKEGGKDKGQIEKKEKKMTTSSAATTEAKQEEKKLIAIDAGHQEQQNSQLEPIGPGASEKKIKVSSGTEGVETGVPEYKVNLQVSQKLKKIFQQRGYEVLMIREKNDVDLSNRERAQIANEANADIFLRIHCNSAESSLVNGALTLCPDSENPYCDSEMIEKSSLLSELVLEQLCRNTGAKKLSIIRTSDMSGINWCEIPVTIVEMGFMSNPEEDEKLNQESYQERLAEGIADGVDTYFEKGMEE